MNIESYSDLEKQIQRYQSEVEHLNDIQRQLNESNLSIEEKNREQESITNRINDTNVVLNNLLEIQRAYKNFVQNLKILQRLYSQNEFNNKEAQEEITVLQNEIIKAREILPQSLQREIRDNAIAQSENLNNDVSRNTTQDSSNTSDPIESSTETQNNVDYKNEYNNLMKELEQILGDKDLDEIGLNDYDEIEKKYNEVSEKRDKLIEAVNNLKNQISEEDFNDLLDKDSEIKRNIDENINEFHILKSMKEVQRIEIEISIDSINIRVEELQTIDPNNAAIEKGKNKIEELKNELDIVLKGGITKDDLLVKEVIDEIDKEIENIKNQSQRAAQNQSQGPVPVQPQGPAQGQQQEPVPVQPQGPAQDQQQGPTQVQPIVSNTLDSLINRGVLPKNLAKLELISICNKLHIQIADGNAVLTNEQIERLTNDHEIQVALLGQRIKERNQRKISEYDSLIAKYESILKDKMEGKEFSDEYIAKVKKLLDKSKSERQTYIDRNSFITEHDHNEFLGTVSKLKEGKYDEKAADFNEKLRSQYEKLDTLREERNNAKSKFKQRRDDKKIRKTTDKIRKLRNKKGKIANKQTQIVNKNADKYISKMAKMIKKHLTRQGRVETSVDKITDLNARIDSKYQERQNIDIDRQTETRLLDRIGLAAQDKVLQAQTAVFEVQKKAEDFVGRLR